MVTHVIWQKDVTGVDSKKKGSFRSLNGAADENIFTGRASKAGFYCFFKVWRDMPYDAVLDYDGILYRVEIKGSSNSKFNFTRGGRSGRQIKKSKRSSRERILSRDDCDFAVGVDSNNGDCYIIPEDVIEAVNLLNLGTGTLSDFNEKWKLFMPDVTGLSKEQTRDGIADLSLNDLAKLASDLNIGIPKAPIQIPHTRTQITDAHDAAVYTIWSELAKRI